MKKRSHKSMSVALLKDELDKRGVVYDKKARKAALVQLLTAENPTAPPATSATASELSSGLIGGRFPSGLFIGGYLNFEDVQDLRLVCKGWHAVITDSSFRDKLPDWESIVVFLNMENTLNLVDDSPGTTIVNVRAGQPDTETFYPTPPRATADIDPRSDPGFAMLPAYDRAVELLRFQKMCVRNLLQHFVSSLNPIGWEWMGWDEKDAWAKLEESDRARYDTAIGVCCLALAREDLRRERGGYGGWWDNIFAGDDDDDDMIGLFDGMCGSSFRDTFVSYQGFFGWDYASLDPQDLDTSDEKIISMATSELEYGEQVENDYATPIVATGPSESFERLLGSHGVACDIFGAWKKDPEGELAKALAL
ncbi:hypothetical protein TrCOL_g5721 [Triparma columacea]|uniref:F-box domain-containing protein n=1 Tax=Triparma columacea TaxID=722753 RepID=A0A9W7G438_9STRA|nr:hypothetical protein TrCOL_g5721 [Triparma columacea]